LDTMWGCHLAFLGYAGINVAAYFLVPSQYVDARKMGHLVDANMYYCNLKIGAAVGARAPV